MKPYKLQLLQALTPDGHNKRYEFFISMLDDMEEYNFSERLIFTDESTFHLSDDSDDFIFMQDGAPPHFSNHVRRYLNDTIPEQKVCAMCRKEIKIKYDAIESVMQNPENDCSNDEEYVDSKANVSSLNTSLVDLGVSPIKRKRLREEKYKGQKFENVRKALKEKVFYINDVDDPESSSRPDFAILTQMQEKFQTSDSYVAFVHIMLQEVKWFEELICIMLRSKSEVKRTKIDPNTCRKLLKQL
ncbi:hypothetical protein ANN_10714 [Periplaneta americana]|uniref:Uncharacterized protein n=1 Tax=Periplaneta americana TaxID=6978 RepID=A0ABQ8T4P3_PERAM|nr:hypothetical protein ANN_10714 [Periplaneta americana]